MAKSINLKTRESKKSKSQDKYSEKIKTKREYKFHVNQEVIYKGLIEEYRNTLATIVNHKQSRNHSVEYYSIKFALDDEIINDVSGNMLISLENYELELAKEEEKNNSNNQDEDSQNIVSDLEKEIIAKGLEPYRNRLSCFNPILYYERHCEQCGYQDRCVYRKKGKYDKIK
jgi:DNA-binding TFAR19-related protein (PDSD5 family)